MVVVGHRSLAIMRSNFHASTSTATSAGPTSHPGSNGRLEILPSQSGWRKGHSSRGSVGERIQVIPGFKTSAAFLSSLGHNLRISDDDLLPSPVNTPLLRPSYGFADGLAPPSPLVAATMADDEMDTSNEASAEGERNPLEGVPPLSTEVAQDDNDVVAALKLVADSIAQQRNVAARVLIFHPLNMAVFIAFASLLMQYIYTPGNFAKILTTTTGIVMLALVSVRQLTSGYIFAAEEINKAWLGDDQILISRFGDDVIGALVLGWEKGEGRGNRRKKWGKGIVRAWTVKMRYRGKGVGTELLEEAIKTTKERGGEEVVFAEDHAHSKIFLPKFYQAPILRKEAKHRQQLEDMSHKGRAKR